MARENAVFQLRLDGSLKAAFTEAARWEQSTPSQVMRTLIADFVRASYKKEAERQSRIVAADPDSKATLDEIESLQAWIHEP